MENSERYFSNNFIELGNNSDKDIIFKDLYLLITSYVKEYSELNEKEGIQIPVPATVVGLKIGPIKGVIKAHSTYLITFKRKYNNSIFEIKETDYLYDGDEDVSGLMLGSITLLLGWGNYKYTDINSMVNIDSTSIGNILPLTHIDIPTWNLETVPKGYIDSVQITSNDGTITDETLNFSNLKMEGLGTSRLNSRFFHFRKYSLDGSLDKKYVSRNTNEDWESVGWNLNNNKYFKYYPKSSKEGKTLSKLKKSLRTDKPNLVTLYKVHEKSKYLVISWISARKEDELLDNDIIYRITNFSDKNPLLGWKYDEKLICNEDIGIISDYPTDTSYNNQNNLFIGEFDSNTGVYITPYINSLSLYSPVDVSGVKVFNYNIQNTENTYSDNTFITYKTFRNYNKLENTDTKARKELAWRNNYPGNRDLYIYSPKGLWKGDYVINTYINKFLLNGKKLENYCNEYHYNILGDTTYKHDLSSLLEYYDTFPNSILSNYIGDTDESYLPNKVKIYGDYNVSTNSEETIDITTFPIINLVNSVYDRVSNISNINVAGDVSVTSNTYPLGNALNCIIEESLLSGNSSYVDDNSLYYIDKVPSNSEFFSPKIHYLNLSIPDIESLSKDHIDYLTVRLFNYIASDVLIYTMEELVNKNNPNLFFTEVRNSLLLRGNIVVNTNVSPLTDLLNYLQYYNINIIELLGTDLDVFNSWVVFGYRLHAFLQYLGVSVINSTGRDQFGFLKTLPLSCMAVGDYFPDDREFTNPDGSLTSKGYYYKISTVDQNYCSEVQKKVLDKIFYVDDNGGWSVNDENYHHDAFTLEDIKELFPEPKNLLENVRLCSPDIDGTDITRSIPSKVSTILKNFNIYINLSGLEEFQKALDDPDPQKTIECVNYYKVLLSFGYPCLGVYFGEEFGDNNFIQNLVGTIRGISYGITYLNGRSSGVAADKFYFTPIIGSEPTSFDINNETGLVDGLVYIEDYLSYFPQLDPTIKCDYYRTIPRKVNIINCPWIDLGEYDMRYPYSDELPTEYITENGTWYNPSELPIPSTMKNGLYKFRGPMIVTTHYYSLCYSTTRTGTIYETPIEYYNYINIDSIFIFRNMYSEGIISLDEVNYIRKRLNIEPMTFDEYDIEITRQNNYINIGPYYISKYTTLFNPIEDGEPFNVIEHKDDLSIGGISINSNWLLNYCYPNTFSDPVRGEGAVNLI